MKINKADHMIVLYQLIEDNLFKGEKFLMSATEKVDVQLIDRAVVLTYDWYRTVLIDQLMKRLSFSEQRALYRLKM